MQTINGFLKTNGVTAVWCDRNGQTAETPSITVGMCCRFRIAIFRDEIDENGVLVPVSFEEMQSVSYYIALDSDYLQETDPKLVNVSGCSLERDPETGGAVFVCEIPNTAVPSLLDHIQEEEQLTLDMEIGGFEEANDVAVFVTQTSLLVRNRIWLGGTPPSDVAEDPEYWNAAQIQAYLSQTPQIQTSADGESWHARAFCRIRSGRLPNVPHRRKTDSVMSRRIQISATGISPELGVPESHSDGTERTAKTGQTERTAKTARTGKTLTKSP